jgi:SAM-dependent methyltransferase
VAFTAHNILLDNGIETYPAAGFLIEDGERFQAAKRMLNLVFSDGLRGKSIADLGCLEGGYATGFARLGMNVTGIEVRDSNFRNCLYVQSNVNLPHLTFIKDDVENIQQHGIFDAIWASGIFYHLNHPRTFLEKVARVCRRVILIETHFTHANQTHAVEQHRLSDLCEHDDVKGRWYQEYEQGSETRSEECKWSSWSNSSSFWIQKEYLLQAIKDVGFDIVLEQYDNMENILEGMNSYYNYHDRALFVGIKSSLNS